MRRSGISEIIEQPPSQAGSGHSARNGAADSEAIHLTPEEMMILDGWLHAPETPKTVARRATIIREAARGHSNSEIARELAVSRGTVILWRRRFAREGIFSLSEVRPGRGRHRSVSTRTVRAIIKAARRGRTASGGQPSCRSLAETSGVSAATVYRVWDAHGLRRNGNGGAGERTDAATGALVGVYLDPPDRMIVLRCDDSAAPRGGRTLLSRATIRALDRFDRLVVGPCLPRDRERAFLKFLRRIERAASPTSSLLLVLDANGGTHRRAGVRRWLKARSQVRVRVVGEVESTAALLEAAIAEGSPTRERAIVRNAAVRSLVEDVSGYLSLYDGELDRFIWIASVDAVRATGIDRGPIAIAIRAAR